MENSELEKQLLISRYYELKFLIKPIIGKEKIERIFNNSLVDNTANEIKQIILNKLNTIEGQISSGIFLLIKLEYIDLINNEKGIQKTLSNSSKNIFSIRNT